MTTLQLSGKSCCHWSLRVVPKPPMRTGTRTPGTDRERMEDSPNRCRWKVGEMSLYTLAWS